MIDLNGNAGKIRILIVAFSDSIHTSRWISQLDHDKYELFLFPSVPFKETHSLIRGITIYQIQKSSNDHDKSVTVKSSSSIYRLSEKIIGTSLTQKIAKRLFVKKLQEMALMRTIKRIKPGIVHTMETQESGYQVVKIKHRLDDFKWIHSTWGIDLHYFQTFPKHQKILTKLFSQIHTYIAEGDRDVKIARNLGYHGKAIVIPSVGGSLNFALFDSIGGRGKPSSRKMIILKGYEGHERLASAALMALRKIKEMLKDYEIIVYSCSEKLLPLVNEIRSENEFDLKIKGHIKYEDLLDLTIQSRISITNNLSDGVPNTMLEAMALGAFPIQSNTAITDGWIKDGKNGLLTVPTDQENIAAAIAKALRDDQMVDEAADYNYKLIRERLNIDTIKNQINSIYGTFSVSPGHEESVEFAL
jgi:glycosyltransferase involved in cell wall biosynthesis